MTMSMPSGKCNIMAGESQAVCVEWESSVPVDGRVRSEESGVLGL